MPLETLFSCAIAFFGVLLYLKVTGSVASILSHWDMSFEEFNDRLRRLKRYMEWRHIPEDSKRHLEEYMRDMWTDYLGIAPSSTFAVLPPAMKQQLKWERYGASLSGLHLFTGVADLPGGVALLRALSEVLQVRVFQ